VPENRDPGLSFKIIRNSHQYANSPHAIRLLARAASGHAAAAAPRRIMNSRRLMSNIGLSRPGVTTSSRRTRAAGLPHAKASRAVDNKSLGQI